MKTVKALFLSGVFALLIATGAKAAEPTGDGYYVGQATAQLHDCLAAAHSSGVDVQSSVSHDATSCTTTVTFTGTPHCPANQPCPFFAVLIGSVTFDCDGNVISSTCTYGM
jgi:hypothetical protein